MHADFGFLHDLVIVFGVGLGVVLLFSAMRLPAIAGFLLTGVLVGPHGLALVQDQENVDLLAEVGVVVLLFTIGVELSLGQLLRLGRVVLGGGVLQVVLTTAAAAGIAGGLGLSGGPAILCGFVVALSSTAIAMRLLADRAETTTPQGRVGLGILIFQDLAIVPMILAVPFLAGEGGGWTDIGLVLGKAVLVVVVALVGARIVVPPLLHLVLRTRSRELFLLTIIVLGFGTAWLTSEAGLSLALGAFLAGLVVSESEYGHHALGAVLPFRDAFSSLFFVSIGMLLDTDFIVAHPGLVIGTTVAVLLGKSIIVAGLTLVLGYPIRIAVLTGVLLSQVGEFSFLLIHSGAAAGLLEGPGRQLLLAVAVLTMGVTPLVYAAAPRLGTWLGRLRPSPASEPGEEEHRDDHVIIVGHGINGRNVARALRHVGMPYLILEINPETVRTLRKEGEPVEYGDATQAEILRHAGVEGARILVVTLPDAASARRIVKIAHELNPAVHLIVRTTFVGEVRDLYRLGANEVIPEEFETSIEIFSRVLRQYLVPRDVVDRLAREARQEGYEMFRAEPEGHRPLDGLRRLLHGVQLEVYRVTDASALAGKTLAEARLRQETGVLVLAVHREHETTPNPPADWMLAVDDVVLLIGDPRQLSAAGTLFAGE